MTRKSLTSKELVAMYNSLEHGATVDAVSTSLNIHPNSIVSAMGILRKYILQTAEGTIKNRKFPRKQYLRSAKAILAKQDLNMPELEGCGNFDIAKEQTPLTSMEKLNLAFDEFNKSMQEFIVSEVEAKVGAVMQENTQLRQAVSDLKVPNWISNLRQRLNNE